MKFLYYNESRFHWSARGEAFIQKVLKETHALCLLQLDFAKAAPPPPQSAT